MMMRILMRKKVRMERMINLELIYFFEYLAIGVVSAGIFFIVYDRNKK
jgi:hypothetical protein